jgi:autotransporter-associated beta strand protein
LIGISSSTFAPILGDGPGGATSLVKDFPNTWTITGANTYSGGTSVLRGTLTVGGSGTLGASTGNLVVSSPEGATTILNLNVDQIVGSLQGTVESGASATINIGSGKTLTVNQTINTTYEGVIVSAGSLTKSGSGTLTLSGTNSYTGATTINAGTLLINGSTASASAVTVNNAGTLGGSGTVNGTVTVNNGGNLAPGNSPGILHTGALTLNGGSTFRVDLNGGSGPLGTGAGTLYDQAAVIGQIILGGNLAATIGMTPLNIGDKYFIALNDGSDAVSGTFGNAPGNVYNDGTDFFLVNYADNGDGGLTFNDISLTVTAVPEPGSWSGATFTLAFILFGLLRRLPPPRQ